MRTVAAKSPPRRRGGRRILIALFLVVVLIAGGVVWLNVAAQAQVNASAALTVYQPAASISHNGVDFSSANTGSVIRANDSVQTDPKGRAAITLPDGTITRLAKDTTIKLDAAHFSKPNGSMLVRLFIGTLTVSSSKGSVTLHGGQEVTVAADGTIGAVGPITPDAEDPFGPALDASNAVEVGTTPGTEQDFVGAPLHNGERQQYTYSYAGGSLVKASLGYPGSAMKLTVKAPDGQQYLATGKLPTLVINNAPPGIYTIFVDGVSGLGNDGEEPFVAVASELKGEV